MDDNEQSFLDSLAADDDDEVVRLIYADWLEERGRSEEADRQRSWRESKRWIERFVRINNEDQNDPYRCDTYISYEWLIREARKAHEEGDYHINCRDNMEMTQGLRFFGDEFWKHWSIVTGIPVPKDEYGSYSCAC